MTGTDWGLSILGVIFPHQTDPNQSDIPGLGLHPTGCSILSSLGFGLLLFNQVSLLLALVVWSKRERERFERNDREIPEIQRERERERERERDPKQATKSTERERES